MMRSDDDVTITPRAVAVTLVALTLGVASCGFDDSLTSRGFITEGDAICTETILKTGVQLGAETETPGTSQFLGELGAAYGQAASRFGQLDIREEDEQMRKRIVAGFRGTGEQLQQASRDAASGAVVEAEANEAFAAIAGLLEGLRAYGFKICGGRETQP